MSRSFAVKPSVARTQGRGRGVSQQPPAPINRGRVNVGRGTSLSPTRTRPTQSRTTANMSDPDQQNDNQTQTEDLQQRMSHQGAYTMITPNERRRQQIAEQARKEEEQYQRYKENKKLGHVNYVGTVGGGQQTQSEVRNIQARTQRSTKFDSIQKRQMARDSVKQREEVEIMKKKEEQRRKADMNRLSEEERQRKLKEDHRQKNEDFLRRFEGQQKPRSMGSSSVRDEPNPSAIPDHSYEDMASGTSSGRAGNISGVDDSLQQLHTMFTGYDIEMLQDILSQTDSIDQAIQLLKIN